MLKVCVIGVYFGELPNYFPAWLKSCIYNKNVDFYVVTDNQLMGLPSNVHLISMTLAEMKALAERKIGMDIVLDSPFKCCDYKPVYGLIFEDYIKEYDYWGHCDFDMLFGDLSYFIENFHMERYDKFLPLGHLAFYRNTDECNQRFREVPTQGNSYQHSFAVSNTTQFDELGGINAIYNEKGYPFFKKRVFADISHRWKRVKLAERYKDSDDVNYPAQLFYWENGSVGRAYMQDGQMKYEPFMYIHIKKRKMQDIGFDMNKAEAFYITSDALLLRDPAEPINRKLIQKLNPYYGALYEWFEYDYLSRLRARKAKRKG